MGGGILGGWWNLRWVVESLVGGGILGGWWNFMWVEYTAGWRKVWWTQVGDENWWLEWFRTSI